MFLKQVKVGGYDNNFSYMVGNNGKCFVVDPCGDVKKLEESIGECKVVYIINTHDHDDHKELNSHFIKKGAKLIDKDFELEHIKVKMIRTPGHTEDSKCVLVNNKQLITGDTLFVGCVGGIFWKGGEKHLFNSLKKLAELDGDVEVWPGHDYGDKPSSTIGEEKKMNPFLKCSSFEEFRNLISS